MEGGELPSSQDKEGNSQSLLTASARVSGTHRHMRGQMSCPLGSSKAVCPETSSVSRSLSHSAGPKYQCASARSATEPTRSLCGLTVGKATSGCRERREPRALGKRASCHWGFCMAAIGLPRPWPWCGGGQPGLSLGVANQKWPGGPWQEQVTC